MDLIHGYQRFMLNYPCSILERCKLVDPLENEKNCPKSAPFSKLNGIAIHCQREVDRPSLRIRSSRRVFLSAIFLVEASWR